MKEINRYTRLAGILIVLISTLYLKFYQNAPPKHAAPAQFFTVARVIDGDTIKLSDGSRVRLIGIDTPESNYSNKLLRDAARSNKDIKMIQTLGKKAGAFTKNLCLGKNVRLEFDVEKKDRYGRLLAYVYLSDGTFLNAKIIEEGYAQVMTVPPNVRFADFFIELQQKARSDRKGLWRESQPGSVNTLW